MAAQDARGGGRAARPVYRWPMTADASPRPWPGRPVRAVMIDLDGTLIDTLGDFEAALNQTLAALGRPAITRAQIARLVGRGSQHLLQAVLARQTPDPDAALLDRAWDEYQRAYLAVNGRHSQPYPGVREGLAALRARGLPLACVTNKPLAFTRPLLAHHGLDGFFSQVIGGDSFARKKPDPLPLLETCRLLGTPPGATLMVGDSRNDAEAARAAGCPVLLLTYGYNHGAPVREVDADGFADSLADIAALLEAAP